MTSAADSWPRSAFWTFSLDLYGRSGVKDACLSLQDRRGLDVNILLWAIWLGARGAILDPRRLAEAEVALAGFRSEVVQALRAVRRHVRAIEKAPVLPIAADWSTEVERLGDRIAAAELDGEHLVQLVLERLSKNFGRDRPPGAPLAAVNIASIAAFGNEDRRDLRVLITKAFPKRSSDEIECALKNAGLG